MTTPAITPWSQGGGVQALAPGEHDSSALRRRAPACQIRDKAKSGRLSVEALEEGQQGSRLVIVDPSQVPSRPKIVRRMEQDVVPSSSIEHVDGNSGGDERVAMRP